MKGLGRNLKFWTWMLHKTFIGILVMVLLMSVVFSFIEGDMSKTLTEYIPMYLVLMSVMSTFSVAWGSSDVNFRMSVSLGSGRKPSSYAMAIAEHILVAEQLFLLWIGAVIFTENSLLGVVRGNPMLVIGIMLLLLAAGILINIVNIRFSGNYGAFIYFIVLLVAIVVFAYIGVTTGAALRLESLAQMNSWGVMLIGLAVDLILTFVYCRVVRNADLKLA